MSGGKRTSEKFGTGVHEYTIPGLKRLVRINMRCSSGFRVLEDEDIWKNRLFCFSDAEKRLRTSLQLTMN